MSKKLHLSDFTTIDRFTQDWQNPFITKTTMKANYGVSIDTIDQWARELNLGFKSRGKSWGWKPKYSYEEIQRAKKLGYVEGPKHLKITTYEYYQYLNYYKLNNNKKYKDGKPYQKVTIEEKDSYEYYHNQVTKITNSQPLHTLAHFEKRGRVGYHLDHKYSIKKGFENNILPYYIGHINNLEMLPYDANVRKQDSCSITEEELYNINTTNKH